MVTVLVTSTIATMDMSFSNMFIAGPAVSLNGLPTVSPTTAALWFAEPFAYAALELGFTEEVCWPHQPRRPSRATGQIPLERMAEERKGLRPVGIPASELALRVPVQVGPAAEDFCDGRGYAMPPEAAGLPGTMYLYRNRVKIGTGRWQAEHERFIPKGQIARLPEHRAAHLATVAGERGKRYLKRKQLSECGQATVASSPRSFTVALGGGTPRSTSSTNFCRSWVQRSWRGRVEPPCRPDPPL